MKNEMKLSSLQDTCIFLHVTISFLLNDNKKKKKKKKKNAYFRAYTQEKPLKKTTEAIHVGCGGR